MTKILIGAAALIGSVVGAIKILSHEKESDEEDFFIGISSPEMEMLHSCTKKEFDRLYPNGEGTDDDYWRIFNEKKQKILEMNKKMFS